MTTDKAMVTALREALEWYGEQARLARLIHSEGDKGRYALAGDGGKRANEVLSSLTLERGEAEPVANARAILEAAATAVDREWRASGALSCTMVCAIIRSSTLSKRGEAEETPAKMQHVSGVQALLNSLDRTAIAKIVDPSAWANDGGYDIEQTHSGPALIAADQIITYVLMTARALAATEGSDNG